MTEDGWIYLTTERMTVAVRVEDGLVAEGPPIVRRFLGQPAQRLAGWLRQQGGFREERL